MKGKPPPLFLARENYRTRRIIDAARLLPVLGVLLIFLPMLWSAPMTSTGMIYLFSVWIGLIAVTGVLARKLDRSAMQTENEDRADPALSGGVQARTGRESD